MKFYIYTFIYLLLITSCQNTKVDYVVVSGNVSNTESLYVTIKNSRYSSDIDINDDGSFYDTLQLNTGYYNLYVGWRCDPVKGRRAARKKGHKGGLGGNLKLEG